MIDLNLSKKRDLAFIVKPYTDRVEDWFLNTEVYIMVASATNPNKKERKYYSSAYERDISINTDIFILDLLDYFKSNIKNIVSAPSDELINVYNEWSILNNPDINQLERAAKLFIKLYEEFIKKHGYWLSSELKVPTCPYCNRHYTFTIDAKKKGDIKTRPQFDHFHPKSKYPLLALSFYNLVPACPECNHVKGNKEIGVHPYQKGMLKSTKFRIEDINKKKTSVEHILLLKEDEFNITLKGNTEEKENIKKFGLVELYNEHKDYVKEIMDKTQAYNESYRQGLIDAYQGSGDSSKDVYEFTWGRYLDIADHEKRPLSKLTKDILDQLKVK